MKATIKIYASKCKLYMLHEEELKQELTKVREIL